MTTPYTEVPDHPGFIDRSLVPLCAELTSHAAVFEAELARLPGTAFVPWFDVEVYSGDWLVFPLVAKLATQPPGFDLPRNRALCPASAAILEAHPRVLLAGFSRLLPGARVHAHSDHPGANVLRFHLRLGDAERAALQFDEAVSEFRSCRSVLFDHSMPHSSYNLGAAPRDVLLVDILLTAEEVAAVVRARGAVHLGTGHGR